MSEACTGIRVDMLVTMLIDVAWLSLSFLLNKYRLSFIYSSDVLYANEIFFDGSWGLTAYVLSRKLVPDIKVTQRSGTNSCQWDGECCCKSIKCSQGFHLACMKLSVKLVMSVCLCVVSGVSKLGEERIGKTLTRGLPAGSVLWVSFFFCSWATTSFRYSFTWEREDKRD